MLTEETKNIVKATIPVLEEHGTEITSAFYKHMFEAHPELLNVFNKTNQKLGRQQTALAQTVIAAAKHIDHLEAIVPNVNQIAHKHRALEIKPEHYPIVGENLIWAIQHVLGDAATPEIVEAWTETYGVIADVFIQMEAALYDEADWQGFVPFKVVAVKEESPDIKSFTVQSDAVQLKPVKAGQYITVKVHPEDETNDALRHYSICSVDTSRGLKFAVKRDVAGEERGMVSNYLHDHVKAGDELLLSAPAGEFLVETDNKDLVFISGGVGMTPLMSMLEDEVDKCSIKFIHSAYNRDAVPFKDEITKFHNNSNVEFFFNYSESEGRLTKEKLSKIMSGNEEIYMCGSVGFMEGMLEIFSDMGIDRSRVHFEPFGPKMSITV
ncbi:globin domain-containing protein [Macrococcoides caseolyticum]|uniref:globin domain-containing protein n=1 Tax=Macrococcoides caseolyticum TaxID=69966 RepID=UPI000C34179C|nr:globin domain-containing protein [Macrococcus caseolyticus]PKD99989.1 flavohemoprotein [Macrococcus caseolyticus]PKF20074.1 flavohemoprotein [Macrococcus caseolyticus]